MGFSFSKLRVTEVTRIYRNANLVSRFGLSYRRIPDSIIEPIFFRWGANLFKNCGFCSYESDFVAHPRFRVGLRIRESHGHFQSVGIDAAPAFLQAHLVAMRISEVVEPGSVIVTDRVGDEGVSLPFANGVSVPGWVGIFRQRSAIGPNRAPDVMVLHMLQNSVGRHDKLKGP